MLRVDLRELSRGPIETVGEIAPDDPAFAGLGLELLEPVRVEGRLQSTGPGEFYWRGRMEGSVQVSCRRCLREIRHPVSAPIDVLFSEDPEAEDNPDVYPVPPNVAALDLADVVRQELALAVPTFLVCREECAGLCPKCGADLNAGPCDCAPAETN